MCDYRAVIVIGLPKKDLTNTDLDLLDQCLLEEFSPTINNKHTKYNIIGLELAASIGLIAKEFEWNDSVIEQLKNQFYALTNKEARIFLAIKGY